MLSRRGWYKGRFFLNLCQFLISKINIFFNRWLPTLRIFLRLLLSWSGQLILMCLSSHFETFQKWIHKKAVFGDRTKFFNISPISKMLGQNLEWTRSLIGFHSFTGCHQIPAFAGKGKLKPLRVWRATLLFKQHLRHSAHLKWFQMTLLRNWTSLHAKFAALKKHKGW